MMFYFCTLTQKSFVRFSFHLFQEFSFKFVQVLAINGPLIFRLTNLTSLKKRIKKSDSESNSSVEGSTKHVSKKARKTKKAQRNKFVSNSENSGDDETHNDAASNEDCPAVDNNTILADIAVVRNLFYPFRVITWLLLHLLISL